MNLTAELILYIINNLLNEKDRHAFATSNKRLWVIAILPRAKPFALMRKINFGYSPTDSSHTQKHIL